jgi:hypothetical protein
LARLALGLYEDEVAKGRGGAMARGDGGGANPAAALSSARGRGRWGGPLCQVGPGAEKVA